MVDLVKIRKKAKEKKGPEASGLRPEEENRPEASGLRAEEENRPQASGLRPEDPPVLHKSAPSSSRLARFLETAGERQVIAAAKAETGSAQVELLTFVIAGENYALDIENVAEIVTPRPITRVPNTDDSIVGIFSLRGTIVTLIDVRRRLGHGAAGPTGPDSRVVVTRQGSENLGFLVDRVMRVVKVDVTSIEPQPVVHVTEQDDSVRGVFRHNGALTILLDLDKLLVPALS